ncbi:MAG TPA: hypothetical protein VK040_10515 [Balneolaceae bacterium]|nr:hypothetical protein [Balneolaceae bacterium]
MSDTTEQEYQEWMKDLNYLVDTLKLSFESADARFTVDELNDTLYIELEGLEGYSEEEIEEIATPLLEITELEFEDIILLPLSTHSD